MANDFWANFAFGFIVALMVAHLVFQILYMRKAYPFYVWGVLPLEADYEAIMREYGASEAVIDDVDTCLSSVYGTFRGAAMAMHSAIESGKPVGAVTASNYGVILQAVRMEVQF